MLDTKFKPSVAEIRARLEAATPGPWEAEIGEDIQVNAGTALTVWNETGDVGTPARSWRSTDRIFEFVDAKWELEEEDYSVMASNAEFIAHAPTDVAFLLEENARLEVLLAEVKGQAEAIMFESDAEPARAAILGLLAEAQALRDDLRAHGVNAEVRSRR